MKKASYIGIGMVIGFILSFGIGANAAEIQSVVGKVIQGEYNVSVDGKQLDSKAIIVNKKSYLPVTDVAAATGYDTTFVGGEEGILLTSKEEQTVTDQSTPTTIEPTMTQNSLDWYLNEVKYRQKQLSIVKSYYNLYDEGEAQKKAEELVIKAQNELDQIIIEMHKYYPDAEVPQ